MIFSKEFRMRHQLSIVLVLAVVSLSLPVTAQQIQGDYLETRSADVFTG